MVLHVLADAGQVCPHLDAEFSSSSAGPIPDDISNLGVP
jgi:hypothetical protein